MRRLYTVLALVVGYIALGFIGYSGAYAAASFFASDETTIHVTDDTVLQSVALQGTATPDAGMEAVWLLDASDGADVLACDRYGNVLRCAAFSDVFKMVLMLMKADEEAAARAEEEEQKVAPPPTVFEL